VAFLSIEDSA